MFNRTLQERFSRQACPEPFLCQDKLRRRYAKTTKNEIPISNIEMRNNNKIRMTKIPNCLVNCFEHLHFCHYNLFRISDFVLRVFCSPFVASFAPWNILFTEALSFHSRHYFTGRALWNTDSTKIVLFSRSAIPQGRVIFSPIPYTQIQRKISKMFG